MLKTQPMGQCYIHSRSFTFPIKDEATFYSRKKWVRNFSSYHKGRNWSHHLREGFNMSDALGQDKDIKMIMQKNNGFASVKRHKGKWSKKCVIVVKDTQASTWIHIDM